MYGKEALDTWIAVLKQISYEAYSNPEIVKTAPHNQAIHRVKVTALDDPSKWAMTWRAFKRKRAAVGTLPGMEEHRNSQK
jgi:glycine dehydrogenase subunit 2